MPTDTLGKTALLTRGLAALPPNEPYAFRLDVYLQRKASDQPLPSGFEVSVSYRDRWKRQHVERYVIGRSYPPAFIRTIAVEYATGAESVRKLDLVDLGAFLRGADEILDAVLHPLDRRTQRQPPPGIARTAEMIVLALSQTVQTMVSLRQYEWAVGDNSGSRKRAKRSIRLGGCKSVAPNTVAAARLIAAGYALTASGVSSMANAAIVVAPATKGARQARCMGERSVASRRPIIASATATKAVGGTMARPI